MKIYTKTGDQGTTSLAYGGRVSKIHPRVETYGDIDELISHLGLIRSLCLERPETASCAAPLRQIESDLMLVSAHFASEGSSPHIRLIDSGMLTPLELQMDEMTGKMPLQIAFVLPSGPPLAAHCHIARTICRRAERSALKIKERDEMDLIGTQYLNRLSDYLFTMARYLCFLMGVQEDFWIP